MLTISSASLAQAQSIALAKLLDLLQTSTSESTIRHVAATILRFTTQKLAAAAKDAANVAIQPPAKQAARDVKANAPREVPPAPPPLLTPTEHAQLCADFPFVRHYPELPESDPAAWAQLIKEWRQHRADINTTPTRPKAPTNSPPQLDESLTTLKTIYVPNALSSPAAPVAPIRS